MHYRRRDLCGAGDLRDGRIGDAALGEKADRRIQQSIASVDIDAARPAALSRILSAVESLHPR